jgi:hypothetical protein
MSSSGLSWRGLRFDMGSARGPWGVVLLGVIVVAGGEKCLSGGLMPARDLNVLVWPEEDEQFHSTTHEAFKHNKKSKPSRLWLIKKIKASFQPNEGFRICLAIGL